ncbi:uncharacterized protein P174DRAFT_444969 [Aspergillus novofumigatus IBT 16806]|uniref:Uncharacterized protein n=1 Tax=Aspergillus novofumigatus (strain IBT 16806) TaxID=1392255 RepID=A0A2I1C0W6_ASPN1|nr:uncharacterized protein P174DRAFT_444969 [Aspergillus novofumigatus IBT 16806]PKX91284.1 hypothetical protein P174DRAFT_444969 [Aspergillus novofumigatus IBT 16806]
MEFISIMHSKLNAIDHDRNLYVRPCIFMKCYQCNEYGHMGLRATPKSDADIVRKSIVPKNMVKYTDP